MKSNSEFEYSTKGQHILLDAWGVDFHKLNNLEELKNNMVIGVGKSGATVLSVQTHQFEPSGITILILLSESHFSIHTYPEKGFAGIDCYTCGDSVRPEIAVKNLIDYLRPTAVASRVMSRGIESGVVDVWLTTEK